MDEQNALSEDQKHTSLVAKVHYKKLQSRLVAEKGKQAMMKLRDDSPSISTVQQISESIYVPQRNCVDFAVGTTDLNYHNPYCSQDKQFAAGTTGLIEENLVCGNDRNRKKKVAFSEIEDKFLRAGLKKYG